MKLYVVKKNVNKIINKELIIKSNTIIQNIKSNVSRKNEFHRIVIIGLTIVYQIFYYFSIELIGNNLEFVLILSLKIFIFIIFTLVRLKV